MRCEKLEGCPFYNNKMPIESGIGQMYKRRYCEQDKLKCARYKVFTAVGKEHVPSDLYPNMVDRAEKIIDSVKNTEK